MSDLPQDLLRRSKHCVVRAWQTGLVRRPVLPLIFRQLDTGLFGHGKQILELLKQGRTARSYKLTTTRRR